MLEEEKLKRKEDKKKKVAASTASKEGAERTANTPTADASEEEVREENEKNQEKEGTRDNLTHSNINDHMRELNSGAGAKDDDTGKMEEDPLPRKKKSRDINKRKIGRNEKEKKRIH